MQGNEACVKAALDSGLGFFAGYPITPATEIAEILSTELPRKGGVFAQMEDEISCMGAVIGASLAGAKAMTATSGPGFSLMQEHIGYAVMAEVPCVIVCVQRGGPSTGLSTLTAQGDVMQSRWGTHGDHPIIVLAPATVEETYLLTVEAFNLAERFRNPVILLSDAVVGHLRERVQLPAPEELRLVNRVRATGPAKDYKPYQPLENGVPPMGVLGDGYRYYISGTYRDETGATVAVDTVAASRIIRRINDKVNCHTDEIDRIETYKMDGAKIAVVCHGSATRSAKQAVDYARSRGIEAGLVRPISLWPFPERKIQEALAHVDHVIVAEMNLGQIYYEIERVLKGNAQLEFIGVVGGRMITPEEILTKISEVKK
jgi:2-oxoglutarate ferredoxin oxidoreductase subunit alpha